MVDSSLSIRICLVMMVKNEQGTLPRCLDAVLPWVHAWSICDTGSTDRTKEILTSLSQTCACPAFLWEEGFQNFGYNRTCCLDRTRKWIHSLPLEGDTTTRPRWFFLCLDADMIWHVDDSSLDSFSSSLQHSPVWYVVQRQQQLSYINIRLIDAEYKVECRGPTHEYYAIENAPNPVHVHPLVWIEDRGDGGCKTNKLSRDLRLLRADLEKNPCNPRSMFYLANTLRDMQNYDHAIAWYRKRIESKGWDQEVYCSWIYVADCLSQKKKKEDHHSSFSGLQDEMVLCWMSAIECLPDRPEAYGRWASFAFQSFEYGACYVLCQYLRALPTSTTSSSYPLFSETQWKERRMWEWLSMICAKLEKWEEGKEASQRLLELIRSSSKVDPTTDSTPDPWWKPALHNVEFYTRQCARCSQPTT